MPHWLLTKKITFIVSSCDRRTISRKWSSAFKNATEGWKFLVISLFKVTLKIWSKQQSQFVCCLTKRPIVKMNVTDSYLLWSVFKVMHPKPWCAVTHVVSANFLTCFRFPNLTLKLFLLRLYNWPASSMRSWFISALQARGFTLVQSFKSSLITERLLDKLEW